MKDLKNRKEPESKIVDIPLPSNLKIVNRCKQCQLEGNLCAELNGSEVCLKPILDKDGLFEGFDIECCKFNREGTIKVVLT